MLDIVPSSQNKVLDKRSLYAGIFIVLCILLALVYRADMKNKKTKKDEIKKPINQKILLTNSESKQMWFDQQSLDLEEVVNQHNEKEITEGIVKNISSKQDELNNIIDQKKNESEIEISQLNLQQEYETKRAYYQALKSKMSIDVRSHSELLFTDASFSEIKNVNKSESNKLSTSSLRGLADSLSKNLETHDQEYKANFLKENQGGINYLSAIKENPISEFEIKAGSIISAALITGINSDLPGNIVAQVTRNVFDSIQGKSVLIPQGSRLIGKYDSRISFGQNRALVIWSRLIFPDGASINLANMQGVDAAGFAGFNDRVDRHYPRIYGNATLLSLVGSAFEFLVPDREKSDSGETFARNVGEQLGQITQEQLQREIDVPPTIIIEPGYKFNVLVMKDMILEPIT